MSPKQYSKLKIGITIISLLLTIFSKSEIDLHNLNNNHLNIVFVKDIVYNLSVGVFSAMIIIWFVDEIGNRLELRRSREAERQAILRFDKILQIYIEKYDKLFYYVVTPKSKRNSSKSIPDGIVLEDLQDLYEPIYDIAQGIAGQPIIAFLEIESELKKQIIWILLNMSFEYYPDIHTMLSNIVLDSQNYDFRSIIQETSELYVGDDPLTKQVHTLLKDNSQKYLEALSQEENQSNLLHPYNLLLNMMKDERKHISEYRKGIERIRNSK